MASQKEKTERALYGPSLVEVMLGAVLALVLGGILAVALLVAKPSELVKAMPKPEDKVKGVFYFEEGSRDPNKARQAAAKRQQFLAGQTVVLNEEELNTLLAPGAPASAGPTAGKAPDKKDEKKDDKKDAAPAAAPGGGLFSATNPNFKITDGKLQVAVPCNLNLPGVSLPVNVVAVGTFEKSGDRFVFVPDDIYLGSLAGARVPALTSYVRGKVMESQKIPDDLAAAWKKISDIKIEGKTVTIAM